MPSLEVDVAGLRLRNPTILASGVLGTTAPLMARVYEEGAGAVVTKSVGLEPRKGYPNPTLVEVQGGYLNAMGLANPGAREFSKEIREAKEGGVTVIGSVYGYTAEGYAKAAAIVESAGADAIELNLSCPHVEETGVEIGTRPDLVSGVVRAVKGSISVPVFAKISASYPRTSELAKVIEDGGGDGITAINTMRAMAIDVEIRRPILSNLFGGLSGPAIKPIAVGCVYDVYENVSIPILGAGGVTDWRDAVEFLLAGASGVQVGTAIASRDLGVFKEIQSGLEVYLSDNGFQSVREIVGLAHGE